MPIKFSIFYLFILQSESINALTLFRHKRLAPLHEVENQKDTLMFAQVLWRHGGLFLGNLGFF